MKKREHLPMLGVGPIYVCGITLLTIAAVLARKLAIFSSGELEKIHLPLMVLGICLMILGVFIWIQAVVVSRVDDHVKKNYLTTTGIYAWVRHPIYAAFMILCTGVLLMVGNAWFLILPFVYWLFMTVLMKNTEEKWLRRLYGQEYKVYCERVNRCWPWPPKKNK